jgi:hypothetical protein
MSRMMERATSRKRLRGLVLHASVILLALVVGSVTDSVPAFITVMAAGVLWLSLRRPVQAVAWASKQDRSTLRALWRAWDSNPVSVANRRFLYRYGTPLALAGLVLMLVVRQWVAAGFMAFLLAVALESGARTPGTYAHRIASRVLQRARH